MGIAGQESLEVNGPLRGVSLQNLSYCIGPTNPSKSLLLRRSSDGRKPGGAYLDDDEAFGGEDSERYTWVRSPPRLVALLTIAAVDRTDASICGRSSGIRCGIDMNRLSEGGAP